MNTEKKIFIDEQGFKHCAICGEPIEIAIPANSIWNKRTHYRQCACERQANEQERSLHAERERQAIMKRNEAICFGQYLRTMKNWTFENSTETTPVLNKAKDYVSQWNTIKQNNLGFLLWGPVGTGKTYIACCIANALLDQGITVRMTKLMDLVNELFDKYDKNDYLDELTRYELLILDDFGSERETEYVQETVFNIIDRRYCSGKPTIITTNLSLEEIRNDPRLGKRRIYDRILEMCTPVFVGGKSKRMDRAAQNMAMLQNLDSQ